MTPEERRERAAAAAKARWGERPASAPKVKKPRAPRAAAADPLAFLEPDLRAWVIEQARLKGCRPLEWVARCIDDARQRMGARAITAAAEGDQAATRRAAPALEARTPAVARAALEAAAAGAGIAARAMEGAGVVIGNVRPPLQKRGADPKAGAAPAGRAR